MKKTTIQISEETKEELREVMYFLNLLLKYKGKSSLYFDEVRSYDDLLLNYAARELKIIIDEEFKKIGLIDITTWPKFPSLIREKKDDQQQK